MEEIKEGYTRVSEVLSQWNQFAHIDPHVLANKCRIGTEVHEKISLEEAGIFIETSEDTKGYLKSWVKWKEESEMEIIETEKRLYCEELKITGCLDAYTSGETIIDYKTSASANKKMWAIQASFYNYLANANGWETADEVMFLHLRKDGKKAKEVWVHCTEELWEVAKSALHTYRYFNG